MKEKLLNNLKLKIVAILFAAGLWMISININDPYQSKEYSVSVQLQNMNVITGAGKYVEVVDNSDQINVRVRGNRSVMDSFTNANILATADLRNMDPETFQVPIIVSAVKTTGNKIESIRADEEYLTVKMEDIKRIQKNIDVEARNQPARGYIMGSTRTEQNALKISGPASLVDKVHRVLVSFDLDGAKDDLSMILPVELYDEEGRRINDDRLITSIEEVHCIATILSTKEVPISLGVKGMAAQGYDFTGEIVHEPDKVMLAGKSSVLKNVNEIMIEDVIDITDKKQNIITTINLRNYLPENTELADDSFDGVINAIAIIEKEETGQKEFGTGEIELLNVPENVKAEIVAEDDKISVDFIAFASQIEALLKEDIKLSADVSLYMEENDIENLEEGEYKIPIIYELPEGLFPKETDYIMVRISLK